MCTYEVSYTVRFESNKKIDSANKDDRKALDLLGKAELRAKIDDITPCHYVLLSEKSVDTDTRDGFDF